MNGAAHQPLHITTGASHSHAIHPQLLSQAVTHQRDRVRDRDRDYDLVGLDGNVYGSCILFPGDALDCGGGTAPKYVRRKFRCLTEFTAAQIIAASG